jgi:Family of unknown function (DUF6882)
MAMARAAGALRVRFPAADRMWVIGDAAEAAGAGRRGWVVRERLLALAGAGGLAPVVSGFAPQGVSVAVRIGGVITSALKDWTFWVEARGGGLWIGPPDAPGEGHRIDLVAGRWTAEVGLMAPGEYEVRLAPAEGPPRPLREVPWLGPGGRMWDRDVTRPAAVEELVERAALAQAPSQRAFCAWAGAHDRFVVDLERGRLHLSRGGKPTFSEDFHAIATCGDRGGFRWAWANPTIAPALSARSGRARELGAARGLGWLTDGEIGLPAADVRRLVALATRAMGLDGFYPAPYEHGVLYVGLALPGRFYRLAATA